MKSSVASCSEYPISVTNAPPTEPNLRMVGPVRNPERRPHIETLYAGGCLTRIFLAVLILAFLCGASLMIYVLFPPQPLNVVVMGLDAREGEGRITRSDTVMLFGVNPGRLQVSLLSIPRDVFIEVPGYGLQRINTINVLGEMDEAGSGPQLLSLSIAETFGIVPDRYVRLDFRGFRQMIDAVGGIDIYVEKRIVDNAFPTEDGGTSQIVFEPGWQHMDGERALIYARTRHQDDDYQRASRQQQVLSALVSRSINPLVWPSLLVTINQVVETDLSLPDFVRALPSVMLSGGNFDRLVIDREWVLPGNGFVYPDVEALQPWLENHFG